MGTKNSVGNSLTGATGTGTFVGATSPTLITPNIGTPSAGVLTNCSGLKFLGANGAGFRAVLSGNQTVTNNAITKVQCDTEVFDTGSYYDNATNFRYTPLIAGKYLIGATLYGITSAAGICNVFIYKNGAEAMKSFAYYIAGGTLSQTTAAIVTMNGSTDYLELYAQITGTSVAANYTGFWGCLIEAN